MNMFRLNNLIFQNERLLVFGVNVRASHLKFAVSIEGFTKCFVSLKVVKFLIFFTRLKTNT